MARSPMEANMRRVNLNLDISLLEKLDAYAASLHVPRSAGLSVILSNFFASQELMGNIGDLMAAYKLEQEKRSNDGQLTIDVLEHGEASG